MLTIEALEKKLKSGELNSIYLLYGEETFLLETSLKKIKTLFGEKIKGINYIEIDDTNVNNILSDIETPAFGYNKKLIIAKKSGLFSKEGKKKTSYLFEVSSNLAKYIDANINILKESMVLVFIEDSVEKNDLFKSIEKYGIICNYEKQNPLQIAQRLKAICKAYKVNIDDDTLRYLIEIAGTSMQDLINEIRKLIEYVRSKWYNKKG